MSKKTRIKTNGNAFNRNWSKNKKYYRSDAPKPNFNLKEKKSGN